MGNGGMSVAIGWRKRQMTKDKALEMALILIEQLNMDGWVLADFEPQMYACISAIKAALEAKDEPVAWEQFYEHMAGPNYVAPQRTWVGLTDEEQHQLWRQWIESMDGWGSFYRAIEAKLKEKNT